MLNRLLAFSAGIWILIILPARADERLLCGETTFDVEQGFFSGSVTAINATGTTPFCVSNNPAELTQTLSFREKEVWCVTLHHVSLNSRPLAKKLWVLNRLSKKLYHYDYIFAEGSWVLHDKRHETCETAEQH